MTRELTRPGIPPLHPGDLLAASAIVAAQAVRTGRAHWTALADRLAAAEPSTLNLDPGSSVATDKEEP